MTAEPRDVEEIRADIARQRHREVLARLAAADRENAELRENLGTERLVHALQEQRLSESESFGGAPRWDEDRVVIERDWLDGRCGRCGEALPRHDSAERDDLRAQLAAAQAQLAEARAWLAKAEPYPGPNGDHFAGLDAALRCPTCMPFRPGPAASGTPDGSA